MASIADIAAREEVRRAGLPAGGPLPHLLMLLRGVEDTHIDGAAARRWRPAPTAARTRQASPR